MKEKINVTEVTLPDIHEYTKILKMSWDKKWISNNGDLHRKLEQNLCSFLGVKYLTLVNNATLGLIIAQRALGFKGEIITTPYSFIATSNVLKWDNLEPVFVDVDSMSGNLTPANIENAITDRTGGIMAVHNYGIPYLVDEVESLSKKYNLPLIYDSAPAFGVTYNDKSILEFGDLSVLSFHATKVFTTFEGGAIISKTKEMKTKLDRMKNFSIIDEEQISGNGINAKMNEAEAAMGLLQLKYIDQNIQNRKYIFEKYLNIFNNNQNVSTLRIASNVQYNAAYFPIFFKEGIQLRDKIYKAMRMNNIFCRKYWYPLFPAHDSYKKYRKHNLTNARILSDSVLCLPIFAHMSSKQFDRVIEVLKEENIIK